MTRTPARRRGVFRQARGTTMVEIMVGLLILSFTALLATSMFPSAGTLRHRSNNYTRAASIAQRKLEQIRRIPCEELNYGELVSLGIIEAQPDGTFGFNTIEQLDQFYGSATSGVTLTGVGTDLIRIDVSLTWEGARFGASRVDAMTFIASRLAWRE